MAHFVHDIVVRYADTDAQGHVFFANYFTYFDEAMTGYLHAIDYPPARMAEEGMDFMYVDAHCSYRAGAVFEDRVSLGFGVTKLGNTSISAALEARVDGVLIATGELVWVCVDAANRTKMTIPEDLRVAIQRFEQVDL